MTKDEPALTSAAFAHRPATRGPHLRPATRPPDEDAGGADPEPRGRQAEPDVDLDQDPVQKELRPSAWDRGDSNEGGAQEAEGDRPHVRAPDFLRERRRVAPAGPATWGLRGRIRRWSGGLLSPSMSAAERAWHRALEQVQATWAGPRTVVVVNPKGGAHKTTDCLLTGRTFGVHRGGGVVVWDNNETVGTLGQRARPANHSNTARELLEDLDRFADTRARIGDLSVYIRGQGPAHFDVLASDERPEVTGEISGMDFDAIHGLLTRFYRLVIIDTGNNMRADNWLRAVDVADLLVVSSTIREDTGSSGLWMLDALDSSGRGGLRLQEHAVTVLSDPAPHTDPALARQLTDAYASRTRAVVRVPYDPALAHGAVMDYARLSPRTTAAWLRACAEMAAAL